MPGTYGRLSRQGPAASRCSRSASLRHAADSLSGTYPSSGPLKQKECEGLHSMRPGGRRTGRFSVTYSRGWPRARGRRRATTLETPGSSDQKPSRPRDGSEDGKPTKKKTSTATWEEARPGGIRFPGRGSAPQSPDVHRLQRDPS